MRKLIKKIKYGIDCCNKEINNSDDITYTNILIEDIKQLNNTLDNLSKNKKEIVEDIMEEILPFIDEFNTAVIEMKLERLFDDI